MLAYSNKVGFYNMLLLQGYACLLMIPTTFYILGFISHHIMPLVINGLVGGQTCIPTSWIKTTIRNQVLLVRNLGYHLLGVDSL